MTDRASGAPTLQPTASPTPVSKPGSRRNVRGILASAVFLLLVVGGAIAFYLTRQTTELRQRAANTASCGWCAGQDQCRASTGEPGIAVDPSICTTGNCCLGYNPGTGSGGGGSSGGTCTEGQRTTCGADGCSAQRQKLCQPDGSWGPCVNSVQCGYVGAGNGTTCNQNGQCQSGYCNLTTQKCENAQAAACATPNTCEYGDGARCPGNGRTSVAGFCADGKICCSPSSGPQPASCSAYSGAATLQNAQECGRSCNGGTCRADSSGEARCCVPNAPGTGGTSGGGEVGGSCGLDGARKCVQNGNIYSGLFCSKNSSNQLVWTDSASYNTQADCNTNFLQQGQGGSVCEENSRKCVWEPTNTRTVGYLCKKSGSATNWDPVWYSGTKTQNISTVECNLNFLGSGGQSSCSIEGEAKCVTGESAGLYRCERKDNNSLQWTYKDNSCNSGSGVTTISCSPSGSKTACGGFSSQDQCGGNQLRRCLSPGSGSVWGACEADTACASYCGNNTGVCRLAILGSEVTTSDGKKYLCKPANMVSTICEAQPVTGPNGQGSSGSGSGGQGGSGTSSACISAGQTCSTSSSSNGCCTGSVCQGPTGNQKCQTPSGNVCPGGGVCGGTGGFLGFQCGQLTNGQCLENPKTFNTFAEARAYASATGCGQVDQVCVGGSNNNNLCGSFEIITSSCGGGSSTPPPGQTPPPVGPHCLNIAMDKRDVKVGDAVTFTCGTVTGAARYEFRVKQPNGTIKTLTAQNNVSQTLTITEAGSYTAQCRICTSVDVTSCQPFETL